jgi:DNA-binding response OmpR family regulator
MAVVFVVSRDWTLRATVRAELREAGVDAMGLETADDVGKALANGIVPAVVVIDGEGLEQEQACEAIANLAHRTAVLIIDSKLAPAPTISGAERLARPVRIGDIVARVLARLAERAG